MFLGSSVKAARRPAQFTELPLWPAVAARRTQLVVYGGAAAPTVIGECLNVLQLAARPSPRGAAPTASIALLDTPVAARMSAGAQRDGRSW